MRNSIYAIAILVFGLVSCSDSELVENWKNPEVETFQAQKVLVLAISNDVENRQYFENRVVQQLINKGVNAINSDNFFDNNFTQRPQTENEVKALEDLLLHDGYDAILVSKVIGAEDKVTLIKSYQNFNKTFETFNEDYYSNQGLFDQNEQLESYVVYHAESVLYCICPEKERQVIWRASIDVTKLDSKKKAIKDYCKMLMWSLEDQELLITNSKS
ncbi:hypothetical protein [Nonlabens ulvanivorans]|uniref:Cardiolipin synthetase n=1 Tax=Nonlabens ulvanivorans TaxID=906888 RepID=A0A081D9C0_NONUL|nr:hypothetical protein [Nonlabens ulvanivorans]KEZ94438.1 cardiolipin synthetase [Nonlabens ulvanivorans]PRX12332.1 hypothetical protein LY02_02745 [Nonlabens ulvanivorans]GAK75516.1 hypothetical protein JCM19296_1108 [Nonlabens ulvanivorans]